MNKFTKKTNPSKDGAGTGRTGSPWVAGLIIKMGVMMSIIAAAFIARVHLNDKTEQLAADKARITKQIRDRQTEIQTLRVQLAELQSWENINAKIHQYNLALRAVNPSQVRYIKRFDSPDAMPSLYGGDTRVADSSAVGKQTASGDIQ